jgi:hypothetical protein
MTGTFFALALLPALNPKLFAVDLLLIQNARPRLMFACFVLGGMGMALAAGLLDVFVLPRPQTKVGGDRRVDRALRWCPRGRVRWTTLPDQDPQSWKLITRPFSGWTGRLLLG